SCRPFSPAGLKACATSPCWIGIMTAVSAALHEKTRQTCVPPASLFVVQFAEQSASEGPLLRRELSRRGRDIRPERLSHVLRIPRVANFCERLLVVFEECLRKHLPCVRGPCAHDRDRNRRGCL